MVKYISSLHKMSNFGFIVKNCLIFISLKFEITILLISQRAKIVIADFIKMKTKKIHRLKILILIFLFCRHYICSILLAKCRK